MSIVASSSWYPVSNHQSPRSGTLKTGALERLFFMPESLKLAHYPWSLKGPHY